MFAFVIMSFFSKKHFVCFWFYFTIEFFSYQPKNALYWYLLNLKNIMKVDLNHFVSIICIIVCLWSLGYLYACKNLIIMHVKGKICTILGFCRGFGFFIIGSTIEKYWVEVKKCNFNYWIDWLINNNAKNWVIYLSLDMNSDPNHDCIK